jgi:hypothetical protein
VSSSSSVLLVTGEPAEDLALTGTERAEDPPSSTWLAAPLALSRAAGRKAGSHAWFRMVSIWRYCVQGSNTACLAVAIRREARRRTQEATMARDIAVAAVVAFSTGVMSGVVVTTLAAIRSERRRDSLARQSLDLLERKVRRLIGTGHRSSAAHPDSW